eukprot:14341521-Heterocapsa_arctica.AAC.1
MLKPSESSSHASTTDPNVPAATATQSAVAPLWRTTWRAELGRSSRPGTLLGKQVRRLRMSCPVASSSRRWQKALFA